MSPSPPLCPQRDDARRHRGDVALIVLDFAVVGTAFVVMTP